MRRKKRPTQGQALLDAHMQREGFLIPADPDALRAWLVALAELAYDEGRAVGAERALVAGF